MFIYKRLAQQNGPPPSVQISAGSTRPLPGVPATGFPSTSAIIAAGSATPSGVTGPPPAITRPAGSGLLPTVGGPNGDGLQLPTLMTVYNRNVMMGVISMFAVLCIFVVGGRLISKRMTKQRLGSDDYFALAALILFIMLSVEQYLLAYYGTNSGGISSVSTLQAMGKLEFISQLTYTLVTGAAKLCVLLLYRRVFMLRTTWFRIAWWTYFAIVCMYCTVLLTLNFAQCAPNPPSMLWTNRSGCSFHVHSVGAMGFINALLDLILVLLPIRMVWSLQMSTKRKIGVAAIFGLGILTVAVSIARAVDLTGSDIFSGGILKLATWSTVEPAVGIICACLPTMRPVFTAITKVLPSTPRWGTWYGGSRRPVAVSSTTEGSYSYNREGAGGSSTRAFGRDRSRYANNGFLRVEDTEMEDVRTFGSKEPLPVYSLNGKHNYVPNCASVSRESVEKKEDVPERYEQRDR